jgi:hypothetical protein
MNYSKEDILRLRENSIERLLKSALRCARYASLANDERISEIGGIVYSDLEELKELMTRLWDEARNETYK